MRKKVHSEFPFSLEDRTGCLTYPIIAIEETFHAVRVVHMIIYPERKVGDHSILRANIAADRESSNTQDTVYYVPSASENPIQTHLAALRRNALEYGATPEAIRLLGSLEPWTKKEEATLSEKLKAKGKASPNKDALKEAATSTPVAKKNTASAEPKKRGNPDALRKAREARASGPDTRKIKALIKPKDIAARAGTYRHTMISDLLAAKTVQEFRDKNPKYSAGDLRYAIGANIVSVSDK
jgi:hypothetical protein